MILLNIPYLLVAVGIPAVLTIPFYFFNQYLIRTTRPRDSGKRLLIYFLIMMICVVTYIAAIIFFIIGVAKLLK